MEPSDFIRKYMAATQTHQWKNLEPLIHKDAVVTFSTGEVHEGRIAVQKAFERNFELIKSEEYEMTNIRWLHPNEHTAIYFFDFSWKGLINGQLAEGKGVGTSVLVKEDEEWLLLTEHLGRS